WVVICIEIFATRRVSNLTKLLVLRSGTPSGCGHDERLFRWSPRTPTTGYFLATLRVAVGKKTGGKKTGVRPAILRFLKELSTLVGIGIFGIAQIASLL